MIECICGDAGLGGDMEGRWVGVYKEVRYPGW